MSAIVATMKPVLMAFLSSRAVKKLVIDLLEAYVKTTDNTVDDMAVGMIKSKLLPKNPKK